MVTTTEIPTKLLVTAHDGTPLYHNGEKLYFRYDDMAKLPNVSKEELWMRLVKGSPYLKQKHFIDEDMFRMYFILSCDLLEGNVMVYGKERSGKSLWAYHLALRRREFFGIPAVFNRKPKKGFGDYETIPDDELKPELDKFNQIVKEIESLDLDDDDLLPTELETRIRELRFHNRSYVLDEAYKDVDRGHITNRTRAYGQLARQFGHLHTLFIFLSPDQGDITGRLIADRWTHRVECRYELGMCKYVITVNSPKVRGLVKTMELSPNRWGHIWNSYNLVGTTNLKFYN